MKEEKNRIWENVMKTEKVDCCEKEWRLLTNIRELAEE